MPRPRHARPAWIAAAVLCAAASPPALHAALAAAGGTLFEAAPFVLAARLLPAGRLRILTFFGSCGCRCGPLPGALSLPALGLCWLAFGWPIAVARAAVAFAVWYATKGKMPRDDSRSADASARAAIGREQGALEELARLFLPTFGIAFALGLAGPHIARHARGALAPHGMQVAITIAAAIVAGIALGLMMPCATAGVAIAAGLAANATMTLDATLSDARIIAFAMLATSGVIRAEDLRRSIAPSRCSRAIPPGPPHRNAVHSGDGQAPADEDVRSARLAYGAVACALGYVALAAPPGFVSPRLLPMVAVGAVAAAVGLWRPQHERHALIVPGVMLAALVCGAPLPAMTADATVLDRAWPGETLDFTGTAHRASGTTILERATITCCRIDATVSAVALDQRLSAEDGTWVRARGTLVRAPDGRLQLHASTVVRIAEPRDPFAYR